MPEPTDLLSLILHLRPLPAADPTALLPPWWGRAAHALLLNVVRQYDPALAEKLHEQPGGEQQALGNAGRPFSVSTLIGRAPKGALDPNRTYTLRLTALTADLAGILQSAGASGPLSPGQQVELDYLPFQLEHAPGDRAPLEGWEGALSYAELSASLLLSKIPPPRRITIEFASPTTFKSGGKHVPVPMPELVFGSLLERWNAFAPIAFPPEMRRYALECLALSRYQLATRPVPMKSGGLRVGAVGWAAYTTLNYDRYWMSLAGVLAAFSKYSGIGAGTAMGLGQSRQVEADYESPKPE